MNTTTLDDIAALRELIPPPVKFIREGKSPILDSVAVERLRTAPLAAICVSTSEDRIHAQLIGGVGGFMQTNNVHKLSIPTTQIECPPGSRVGIEVVVPGVGETIRINGHVDSKDSPGMVTIDEVYFHCPKAFIRSNLWQRDSYTRVDEFKIDVTDKQSSILTKNMQTFLGYSPFAFLATASAQGADISPHGDHPGFLQIIDDRTIFLPDRPGNRRADSFQNILQSSAVALLVLVPNIDAILCLRGDANIRQDGQLLQQAAVDGKTPFLGLIIDIQYASLVAWSALQFSSVWDSSFDLDRNQIASTGELMADKIGVPKLFKWIVKIGERLMNEVFKHSLY